MKLTWLGTVGTFVLLAQSMLAATPPLPWGDPLNPRCGDCTFYIDEERVLQRTSRPCGPNCTKLAVGVWTVWTLKIRTLPSDIFEGLNNLVELALGFNEIEILPLGIFDGLRNLRMLFLGNNKIKSVPEGIFEELSKLDLLNLGGNQIKNLTERIFVGLKNLTWLSLSSNQIEVIPADIFGGMNKLETLELDDNKIKALPQGVFDGLSNLKYLKLEDNQIEKGICGSCVFYVTKAGVLQRGTFGYMKDFVTSPCDTRWDPWSDTCTHAYLYDMNIRSLPANVFGGLSLLVELNLASNEIEVLPEGIFKGLANLKRLYLGGNRISLIAPKVYWDLDLESLRLCYAPAHNFTGSIRVSTYKRMAGQSELNTSSTSGTFGQSVYMCDYSDSFYFSSVAEEMPNSMSFAYAASIQEWGELGSVASWHGDLVITNPKNASVKRNTPFDVILPALKSVTGSVIVHNTQAIRSVILPNLAEIGGKLVVTSNSELKLLSAPSLRNVDANKNEPCSDLPEQRMCSDAFAINEEAGLIVQNNPQLERIMLSRIENATCIVVECNIKLAEADMTGHYAGKGEDEFCETFERASMSRGNDQLVLLQAPWLDPETECTCPEEGYVLVERANGDSFECAKDFWGEFWKYFFIPLVIPLIYVWLLLLLQLFMVSGAVERSSSIGSYSTQPVREVSLISMPLGFTFSKRLALIVSVLLGLADFVTDILFIKIFNNCEKLKVPSVIFVVLPSVMMFLGACATAYVGYSYPAKLNRPEFEQTTRLRLPNSYSLLGIIDFIFSMQMVLLCAVDLKAISLLPWSIDKMPILQSDRPTLSKDEELKVLREVKKVKELQATLQERDFLPDWQLKWQWWRIWMSFWSFVEDTAQISIQLISLTAHTGAEGCYPSYSQATGTTISIVFSLLRLSEQVAWAFVCSCEGDKGATCTPSIVKERGDEEDAKKVLTDNDNEAPSEAQIEIKVSSSASAPAPAPSPAPKPPPKLTTTPTSDKEAVAKSPAEAAAKKRAEEEVPAEQEAIEEEAAAAKGAEEEAPAVQKAIEEETDTKEGHQGNGQDDACQENWQGKEKSQ